MDTDFHFDQGLFQPMALDPRPNLRCPNLGRADSGAARWGRIWWRGGYPEVRAQWKKHMARSSVLTSKRWYLSLAFWIVVALLLVAFFNMEQQRGG
jgi:hypothetical protein